MSNNSAIVEVTRKEGKVESTNSESTESVEVMDYYANEKATYIDNVTHINKYIDTDGDYIYDMCETLITAENFMLVDENALTANEWFIEKGGLVSGVKYIKKTYHNKESEEVEIDGIKLIIYPEHLGKDIYIGSNKNYNVRQEIKRNDVAEVTYEYRSTIADGMYNTCTVTVVPMGNYYFTYLPEEWTQINNRKICREFSEKESTTIECIVQSEIEINPEKIGTSIIPVIGITLDHTKESIQKDGGALKLTANIEPNEASNKKIIWSTSDKNIATVDESGNVKGKGIGTATITATAMGTNGKTVEATCEILVNQKEIEISKNVGTVTYIYKDSNNNGIYDSCIVKIKLKALTYEITDEEWTYDNEEYCKEYFEIKNETVNVKDKGAIVSSIDINVTEIGKYVVPVTQISLNKDSITKNVGSSEILEANIIPTHASNKKVEWMTSDETIAAVSNGTVRGVREGTATITVKAKGTNDGTEITDTCTVIVRAIPVSNVTIDKSSASIQKGKTQQLQATITPSNATNKNLTWTSSNTSVATVDQNGLVRGVGVGTATITVTTEDGRKRATCNMEVTSPTLERIVVDDSRIKKQYNEGDLLDLSGLQVKAFYSDHTEKVITNYTTNPQDRSQLATSGMIKVTVEYQGKTAEFEINVAPKLIGMKITNPDIIAYKKGEQLDLTGLKVEAIYSNGEEVEIPKTDYEIDIEEGEILEEVGEKEITIKYQEMEKSFIITVTEEIITPTLNKIVITEEPSKKEYKQGEELDLSGLKVEAVYIDGTREPIINYITNPKEGEKLTEVGDKRITIEYGGMEDSFVVTVKEDKNEDGNGSGNQGRKRKYKWKWKPRWK